METTEYAPGRAVDLYGTSSDPTILLWHGMQTDARASVGPLADLLTRHGVAVVVPDWNSHAADGGRNDLLSSAVFARERAGGAPLVLVGWSLGGAAAAGLTLEAGRHEVAIAHTVCLGGAFTAPSPITGRVLDGDLPAPNGAAFLLLHGSGDDVVPAASSQRFAAVLGDAGWPVELVELDTDHGAIAGARYDPAGDRYLPADDPQALSVAADVAARIAAVVRTRT